jgi:type II secretion system protein H
MGRRGYSLVELVVAVAIMAIMAAVAIVKVSKNLPHQRVDFAASVLATDLQYAQQLAVKQRKPVIVIVDSAAKSYSIKDRATNTVYRLTKMGSTTDFRLDQLTQTATLVIFPTGAAAGATTTFTVGYKGYSRTAYMTSAGMIRVP